ncbi:unnamed protein product [Gadus morhua 'NCC']
MSVSLSVDLSLRVFLCPPVPTFVSAEESVHHSPNDMGHTHGARFVIPRQARARRLAAWLGNFCACVCACTYMSVCVCLYACVCVCACFCVSECVCVCLLD